MDIDCLADAGPERDEGVHCDLVSHQCVLNGAIQPYDVVLQVQAQPPKESDLMLVEQRTFPAFNLRSGRTYHELEIPSVVQVEGSVTRNVDGGVESLESEVTFVPVPDNKGAPASSIVVATHGSLPGDHPPPNLQASLVPNTSYTVRVQPLLEPSSQLPPVSFSYQSPNATLDTGPQYDETQRRHGRLRDEFGRPVAGQRVRLEDKLTGEVVSSTGSTDEDGSFELYALSNVMDGQGYNLVVNMETFPPWRVKIAVDGAKLADGNTDAGANVVLPVVPDPVEYRGKVEALDSSGRLAPAPYADLVFVSHFPVPTEPVDLRDRDWCSWRLLGSAGGGAPLCTARVATTADRDGSFSLLLLPGSYNVFISPGTSDLAGASALSTSQREEKVETQPDGAPQSGATFPLPAAVLYKGAVLSPLGRPMPNVTLVARSLALPGPTSEDQVYQYARSTTAVTDDSGRFELAVDVGYFDLSVQPPSQTGFPWIQLLNREVTRTAETTVLAPLQVRAPVIVSGRVVHEDTPLANALVDAFALVKSAQGERRAVHVGQTTSGEDGSYRLALPPEVSEGD
jgi:hypothetical protein